LYADSDFQKVTRSLNRGFSVEFDFSALFLPLFLIVFAAGAGFIIWIVTRPRSTEPIDSPFRLFLELCRAHRLTIKQGWILWTMAKAGQMSSPLPLFVSPSAWDAAREAWLEKQTEADRAGAEAALEQLRQTLHDTDSAGSEPGPLTAPEPTVNPSTA
jgi:hypothetical protein